MADELNEEEIEHIETRGEVPLAPPNGAAPAQEKVVPLAALHEEREARRELERKLRDQETNRAVLDQRLKQLEETWRKSTNPEPQPPSYDDDPLNRLKWEIEQRDKKLAAIEEKVKGRDTQDEQSQGLAALVNDYQAQAGSFAQAKPDFYEAYQFVRQGWAMEAKTMGVKDKDLNAALRSHELGIAARALEEGDNPGEVIYKLAVLRGYKAKADGNQKIENLAKGTRTATSLSQVPGAGKVQLTAEVVAGLSDEDFAAISSDPKKWKALFR
jgi:hypothetical protein